MALQLNSEKPTNFARFRFVIIMFGLAGLLTLSGCLSPITLNKTVLAYNRSFSEISAQELLLNIARVRNHHPIQFTAVSSIAATFNFQMNAGAVPPFGALTSSHGLSPVFGGSVFSILFRKTSF
ncbi:hypothetical protein SAMN05216302_102510 [Nitrosomonas aestuarii]|uniref:Uncharacterized protein n=2 Tax=Nitrosomonas aestuarii TaxID=52441 RepID=A0A1I4E0Y0_9PROT|nr:hypothetical protein SAMN05216302_102510 [Nitrosomonas aestuarii]